MRFISQLINGISSVLQKLYKCFNDATISTLFSVSLASNLPVILVLWLKDFESLIESFIFPSAPLLGSSH